jgi:hypothetical protein
LGVVDATGDGIVQIAYLHGKNVSHSFTESLRRLHAHDRAGFNRIREEPLNIYCSTGRIVPSRNYAVRLFLDETPHEWLFMVDTDMGFAPDTVERLIQAAHPTDRPFVGALCFGVFDGGYDDMGGMRSKIAPTLYRIGHTTEGHATFCTFGDYPADTMVQVAATGAACFLIHRGALEKLRAEHGDHWFDQVYNEDGVLVGEDFSLCLRLGAAGIPMFVHTGIKTSHNKELWISEEDYRRQAGPAPAATAEVAVIVPVMRRPQNAAPFMASLRASTGLAKVYAVCDRDDEITARAWEDAGAFVLDRPGAGGTFAEKVNEGYRWTYEPWLFICGDDVRFATDWLDQAQHVAAMSGGKVIGTNDLGNPRVLAGDHATHLLIAREYVDEHGGSWDGPGVVAHEGYGHWFVDDEIVYAAKQRGVWAMAPRSIVEHMHPMWEKAPVDEVYELGQSRMDADAQLFEARCRTYLPAVVDA